MTRMVASNIVVWLLLQVLHYILLRAITEGGRWTRTWVCSLRIHATCKMQQVLPIGSLYMRTIMQAVNLQQPKPAHIQHAPCHNCNQGACCACLSGFSPSHTYAVCVANLQRDVRGLEEKALCARATLEHICEQLQSACQVGPTCRMSTRRMSFFCRFFRRLATSWYELCSISVCVRMWFCC